MNHNYQPFLIPLNVGDDWFVGNAVLILLTRGSLLANQLLPGQLLITSRFAIGFQPMLWEQRLLYKPGSTKSEAVYSMGSCDVAVHWWMFCSPKFVRKSFTWAAGAPVCRRLWMFICHFVQWSVPGFQSEQRAAKILFTVSATEFAGVNRGKQFEGFANRSTSINLFWVKPPYPWWAFDDQTSH